MGIPGAQGQDARASLPVVAVEHVDGSRLGAHRLQRGAAQEREAGAVVGIVARRVAIQAATRKAGVVFHESQPVSVRGTGQEGHGDPLEGIRRTPGRVAAHGHLEPEGLEVRRRREASIPGQIDVHLMTPRAQGARQRVDHVGQSARLGERFAFGGEHRDAHRWGW